MVAVRNAESYGVQITDMKAFTTMPDHDFILFSSESIGPKFPFRLEGVSRERWAFRFIKPVKESIEAGNLKVTLGSGQRIEVPFESNRNRGHATFFWD